MGVRALWLAAALITMALTFEALFIGANMMPNHEVPLIITVGPGNYTVILISVASNAFFKASITIPNSPYSPLEVYLPNGTTFILQPGKIVKITTGTYMPLKTIAQYCSGPYYSISPGHPVDVEWFSASPQLANATLSIIMSSGCPRTYYIIIASKNYTTIEVDIVYEVVEV